MTKNGDRPRGDWMSLTQWTVRNLKSSAGEGGVLFSEEALSVPKSKAKVLNLFFFFKS